MSKAGLAAVPETEPWAAEIERAIDNAKRTESDTWFTAFSRTAEGAAAGGLQTILSMLVDGAPGISFVGSYPAAELIPVESFARAMERALADRGADVLAYGPTAGDPSLRETIAEQMRRKQMPATADDELDYATQRWHERLEAARRAAELAPPTRAGGHRRASASNPRIKHANRRPTSKGVRKALRRKGRAGAGGSIFERSRGYAKHGSSFPLKLWIFSQRAFLSSISSSARILSSSIRTRLALSSVAPG